MGKMLKKSVIPKAVWPIHNTIGPSGFLGPPTVLNLLGSTGDAGLSQRKSFPAEIETTLNESRPFFLFFLHRNRK